MVVFDVFKMLFHAPGNELLNDGRFSCFWLGDFFLRQKWRGEGVDVVELGFYAPFHYNPRWSVLASRNIHHMNLWKLGYSPVEIEALFALMPSVALGKGTDLNLRWLSEASLDLSSALQPYQTYIEWPENRRCAEYLFEYLLIIWREYFSSAHWRDWPQGAKFISPGRWRPSTFLLHPLDIVIGIFRDSSQIQTTKLHAATDTHWFSSNDLYDCVQSAILFLSFLCSAPTLPSGVNWPHI